MWQRLSALPIDSAVMPLQQALDSPNPAILVSADGWDYPDIPLPVSEQSEGPITEVEAADDDGNPTTLSLEPTAPFGSLQTVFDGSRSLLIATSNGASAQLDDLLSWLGADSQRWSRLSGVAVVAPPGRAPVTVDGPDVQAEADGGDDESRRLRRNQNICGALGSGLCEAAQRSSGLWNRIPVGGTADRARHF